MSSDMMFLRETKEALLLTVRIPWFRSERLASSKRANSIMQTAHWCQLDLGTAAVDKEFDSVDEAAVLASQEDHRFGDFVGFPHPSQAYFTNARCCQLVSTWVEMAIMWV